MEQYAEVVLDLAGNAVQGASVQVMVGSVNGALATIYNASGTQVPNPISTGARGDFAFQAANGKYVLKVTVNGTQYATVGPLTFYDPGEDADRVTQGSVNSAVTAAVPGAVATAIGGSDGATKVGYGGTNVGARLKQFDKRVSAVSAPYSAKGDGTTDDTPAFTAAAAYAATIGADVEVPPPAVKYLLSSDPTIPANVDILGSPHWFSGAGELPIHKFMELSEGVDPRIYHVKDGHLSEPPTANGERFWTGQHAVDIKHDQAYSGADSVKQDCVGHGTRAYVRGKNGRGWGGVDLVQIFPTAVGAGALDSCGYGREIDVNNNAGDIGDFEVIGGLRAKGLLVVSGGANRPEEALYVASTSTANRWLAALRIKKDSCEFGIIADEGHLGPIMTVPKSSKIVFAKSNAEKLSVRLSPDDTAIRVTGNTGADAVVISETATLIRGALAVRATAQSATISAVQTNLAVITAATTVNTISGGIDGQELTILVNAGVVCTLNTGGNLKLAGGANIGLTGAASIAFFYTSGFWWQKAPPVGGLA